MASNPPLSPSYRLSRGFRRASTIALILLVVFVLSAVYSFVQFARTVSASEEHSFALASNNTAEFDLYLNLSNPGFYPIGGFQIHSDIAFQNGTLLSQATSPSTTLGPGSMNSIPLEFLIPLDASGAAASLAVTDQNLQLNSWGNATYAYFVPVSFHVANNFSWGAPFEGLSLTLGTPFVDSNGTVATNVTVSYADHSSFPEMGVFHVTVRSASNVPCGATNYPVNILSQQLFGETSTLYLASGCTVSGGSLIAEFVGPAFALALPAEAIPA